MGLYTTPNTGFLLTQSPTQMQTKGNPWTKFVVPSTGSITHVGVSVKLTFLDLLELTVSSPIKSNVG